jgi:ferritin-like metal-binding protein YciE
MTMDPAQLKKNFEEQIATTDKQIRELEENLAKAKEYKIKLSGGLETIGLLTGEEEAPTEPPAEAPAE